MRTIPLTAIFVLLNGAGFLAYRTVKADVAQARVTELPAGVERPGTESGATPHEATVKRAEPALSRTDVVAPALQPVAAASVDGPAEPEPVALPGPTPVAAPVATSVAAPQLRPAAAPVAKDAPAMARKRTGSTKPVAARVRVSPAPAASAPTAAPAAGSTVAPVKRESTDESLLNMEANPYKRGE